MFRELSPEEEKEFRQWARDNFTPLRDEINEVWHPVVKDECEIMNREAFAREMTRGPWNQQEQK